MGKVIIQNRTTVDPITLIGEEAGVCWGSNTRDAMKNYKRGIDCLECKHGRTFEFPDVYMILDGYSSKVIREFYTHIGGMPTRLQESTRYVDYSKEMHIVVPEKILNNSESSIVYDNIMNDIHDAYKKLIELGIPKEDASMILPFALETKVVCKFNLRTLLDMSHQRLCTRAFHEYRTLMKDMMKALSEYSPEWKLLCDNYFVPKCEYIGKCEEKHSCGRVKQ